MKRVYILNVAIFVCFLVPSVSVGHDGFNPKNKVSDAGDLSKCLGEWDPDRGIHEQGYDESGHTYKVVTLHSNDGWNRAMCRAASDKFWVWNDEEDKLGKGGKCYENIGHSCRGHWASWRRAQFEKEQREAEANQPEQDPQTPPPTPDTGSVTTPDNGNNGENGGGGAVLPNQPQPQDPIR